jgi:hypothetical protein
MTGEAERNIAGNRRENHQAFAARSSQINPRRRKLLLKGRMIFTGRSALKTHLLPEMVMRCASRRALKLTLR